MKKIVSKIAGAVAVVTAATFAFAQTSDNSNTAGENRAAQTRTSNLDKAPGNVDLKSSESGSRFGPGANNGSTYNSAVRSTDIKAGNVSNVQDPAPVTTTVAPMAPAPVVTAAPEPAPMQPAPAVVATPDPTPAPVITTQEAAPTYHARPARADRN